METMKKLFILLILILIVAIKHSVTKLSGQTGLASEWNADHVIEDGTITGPHLEDPLTDDHEFSKFPTTPNAYPTTDRQVSNKMYVDNQAVLRKGWAGEAVEFGSGWTTKKTISIPAGYLHKRSVLVVILMGRAAEAKYRICISDGTHYSYSAETTTVGETFTETITVRQEEVQQELSYCQLRVIGSTVSGLNVISGPTMNYDMFDDAFTIDIQVNRIGAGAAYVEWAVYVIQGS